MKIKHALYFVFAFVAIAVFLVGDGKDGPLSRMQGNSSNGGAEQASAPAGSSQLAASDGEGFAYDSSDSEFDTELIEDQGFEYYGDEDISAQSSDDEADTPARPSRQTSPRYIIPRDNPPIILRHSGPRIDREKNSTIERSPTEF